MMRSVTGLTAAFVLSAAQMAFAETEGYKARGNAAVRVIVDDDSGQAELQVIAGAVPDCHALSGDSWDMLRLCSLAIDATRKAATLRGPFIRTPRGIEAQLQGSTGFSDFTLPVRLLDIGGLVRIVVFNDDQSNIAAVLLNDDASDYIAVAERLGIGGPPEGPQIVAARRGSAASATLTMVADGRGYWAQLRIDAGTGTSAYEDALEDCWITLSEHAAPWLDQCDKSAKDGIPFDMTGRLLPMRGSDGSFAGLMSTPDGGWVWRVRVFNPQTDKIGVELTRADDPDFSGETEILPFAVGQAETQFDPTGTVWRIPQEDLPLLGLDLELALTQQGDGYVASQIAWFRDNNDEISGYCPATNAMFQICEYAQKDGALRSDLALTRRADAAGFGWTGTMTGWGSFTFEADLYRGDAIADWGAADPDTLYLRLRQPGAEGKAEGWMPLTPKSGPMATP